MVITIVKCIPWDCFCIFVYSQEDKMRKMAGEHKSSGQWCKLKVYILQHVDSIWMVMLPLRYFNIASSFAVVLMYVVFYKDITYLKMFRPWLWLTAPTVKKMHGLSWNYFLKTKLLTYATNTQLNCNPFFNWTAMYLSSIACIQTPHSTYKNIKLIIGVFKQITCFQAEVCWQK